MNSDSVPSYSKAPRGLFVQLRVTRIFTGISISPSPSLRQRPSCYTIRAGRNLPDKGFRYLRTVIVTAAVHWGFSSVLLKHLPLTFQHWAGISLYTSAYALAGTCVFVKQSLGPILCHPSCEGSPLFRSYGVRLPSSLTRVVSITLGHLSLSTRVGLRYGRFCFSGNEDFLGGVSTVRSPRVAPQLPPTLSLTSGVDLPAPALPRVRNAPCPMGTPDLPFRVPPLPTQKRYGNVDPLSIAYAFRPRLRPD
jgi:hypothetical protein